MAVNDNSKQQKYLNKKCIKSNKLIAILANTVGLTNCLTAHWCYSI